MMIVAGNTSMKRLATLFLASYLSSVLCLAPVVAFGYWGANVFGSDALAMALLLSTVWFYAERSSYRIQIALAAQAVILAIYVLGMVVTNPPSNYIYWIPVYGILLAMFWLVQPIHGAFQRVLPAVFGQPVSVIAV